MSPAESRAALARWAAAVLLAAAAVCSPLGCSRSELESPSDLDGDSGITEPDDSPLDGPEGEDADGKGTDAQAAPDVRSPVDAADAARHVGGCGALCFEGAPSYAAGDNPSAVAVRDLNGDGLPDIVVANSITHNGISNISVLLADCKGVFHGAVNYDEGPSPVSVAIGDFNGDTFPDIAVANPMPPGGNDVGVLLGDGSGSFPKTPYYYPAGFGPTSVASADFNGDTKLDLAVADSTGHVNILLGDGTGAFARAIAYPAGAALSFVVAVDFNADSILDLAVADLGGNNVGVLLGKGDGTFGTAASFPVGRWPRSLVAGDFNGDAKPDLAVANDGDSSVSILLGNGDGTFQSASASATGSGPYSVTTGDFDGNGALDLATANEGDGTVSVLLGTGAGTFSPPVDYDTFGLYYGPYGITASDLNGDGLLDLAVANGGGNNVVVLFGVGKGAFRTQETYAAPPNGGWAIVSADVNGDAKLDLAVAVGTSVEVSLGKGDGTFAVATDFTAGPGPVSLGVGDFNGDGKVDLAVADLNGGSKAKQNGDVSVLLGNGDGSFQSPHTFAAGLAPSSIVVADLNADGKLDVAVTNSGESDVAVFLGNGDGTLQSAVDYAVAPGPWSVITADFDGDGTLDLVTSASDAQAATCSISMLRGNGNGTFQNAVQTVFGPSNADPTVASGDVNGDGKLDLAVNTGDIVEILLGLGNGSFQQGASYSGAANGISVTLADLNGDGTLDLAFGGGAMNILLGAGDGTFQAAISYVAASGAIAVGDFNGDAKPDLASTGLPDLAFTTVLLQCP